jgi:hypothetical protein
MVKPSNRKTTTIFITLFIPLFFTIAVSGCSESPSTYTQINYSIDTYVVDDNGNNINYTTYIYQMQGIFSDKGQWRSEGFTAGITVNGSSHSEGSTWLVYGDYMVFGASTNNSSLHEDWDNRQFNPGKAGYWAILTYDDITKNKTIQQNVTFNVTILVSSETDKMIKR